MGEISYMGPTRTDRIHYFVINNVDSFSFSDDMNPSLDKQEISELVMNKETFSIHMYRKNMDENAVGFIIPNKKYRNTYFRRAIIGTILGIIWMIIVGVTLIGWILASMLAGFGFSALLAIMEPIGPFLLPIFFITSAICGIPIFTVILYFPLQNRKIAERGMNELRRKVELASSENTFREIKLDVKIYDMAISTKLPLEFREYISEYLHALEIKKGIETVAYALEI